MTDTTIEQRAALHKLLEINSRHQVKCRMLLDTSLVGESIQERAKVVIGILKVQEAVLERKLRQLHIDLRVAELEELEKEFGVVVGE